MNDGNNRRVLVLADDFTGPMTPGSAWRRQVCRWKWPSPPDVSAAGIVLNSDSRATRRRGAADKVAALLRNAATFVPTQQVKKIDSTLRGNPGGELGNSDGGARLPDGGGGPGLSGSRAAYPGPEGAAMCMVLPSRSRPGTQRSENAGEPGGD